MSIAEDNDETTTEVPLSPPSTSARTTITDQTAVQDKNDSDVNDLLDELEEKPRSETELAVENLKESTNKLTTALRNVGTDIDSKFNLTEQARSVDSQLGVSRTLSSATKSIGSLWNTLNLPERTRDLMNQDSVRNISHALDDTLEKTGVKGAVRQGVREVQTLDEQHKIAAKAIGAVSTGISWVANNLQVSSDQERAQQEQERND
mmetsp:Transcript_3071/g.5726  ORF Transcript_3071/g.5726 Transcript_3071/m.5726 type:complete len:206 (+) Transcript_3071:289-906(+)